MGPWPHVPRPEDVSGAPLVMAVVTMDVNEYRTHVPVTGGMLAGVAIRKLGAMPDMTVRLLDCNGCGLQMWVAPGDRNWSGIMLPREIPNSSYSSPYWLEVLPGHPPLEIYAIAFAETT